MNTPHCAIRSRAARLATLTDGTDMQRNPPQRAGRLAPFVVLLLGPWVACAAPPEVAASATDDAAIVVTDNSPAELRVANRVVSTMRADVFGATPAERAEAARERIDT